MAAEWWRDQFPRALCVVAADWYCKTYAGRIDATLARREPMEILRKTKGLYSKKAMASYIVEFTDAVPHLLGEMKRSGNTSSLMRQMMANVAVHEVVQTATGDRDPDLQMFKNPWSHDLANALSSVLVEHVYLTDWWKENATRIRSESRKLRLTRKVMEG